VLVHLEPLKAWDDLRLLRLDLPNDLAIETMAPTRIPEYWFSMPSPKSALAIVNDWLERRASAALRVP
jgi:NDP-sugar pyrophosphorylase family protein